MKEKGACSEDRAMEGQALRRALIPQALCRTIVLWVDRINKRTSPHSMSGTLNRHHVVPIKWVNLGSATRTIRQMLQLAWTESGKSLTLLALTTKNTIIGTKMASKLGETRIKVTIIALIVKNTTSTTNTTFLKGKILSVMMTKMRLNKPLRKKKSCRWQGSLKNLKLLEGQKAKINLRKQRRSQSKCKRKSHMSSLL